MLDNLLDPIVLCFVAGLVAGALRSELKFPPALYETMSIYLLLAIGLKGGGELARSELAGFWGPAAGTVLLGVTIPLIAYAILRRLGRFERKDAAAIAAHYGSVSAVTFAVVLSFLVKRGVPYEEFVTVLLVVLEVPAIAIGILIARLRTADSPTRWPALAHEVFLGKGVFLLLAGLAIGAASGPTRLVAVAPLFEHPFKGVLALFLLEMGLVASRHLGDLKSVGLFLAGFGVGMPLISGALGTAVGLAAGLSVGGVTVLATLAGSASYIAAPAAMRIAVPQANPTLYLTAALGITFPFNVTLGIPIYHWMARVASGWVG